jgi:hypothetical protein
MSWRVALAGLAALVSACGETIGPKEYGQASVLIVGTDAADESSIVFHDANGKMLAQGAPSNGMLSGAMEAGGMITWIQRVDPLVMYTVAGVQPGETIRFGHIEQLDPVSVLLEQPYPNAAGYVFDNGCNFTGSSGSIVVLESYERCRDRATTDILVTAVAANSERLAYASADDARGSVQIATESWKTDIETFSVVLNDAPPAESVEVQQALVKGHGAYLLSAGENARFPASFADEWMVMATVRFENNHGAVLRSTRAASERTASIDIAPSLLPRVEGTAVSTHNEGRQTIAWTSGDLSGTDMVTIDLSAERFAWTIHGPSSIQRALILPLLPDEVVVPATLEPPQVSYLDFESRDFDGLRSSAIFPGYTAGIGADEDYRATF